MEQRTQSKKFIHCLMSGGERRRAERIFDTALEKVYRKIRGAATPGQILSGAIENARPWVEIKRQRVGTEIYQVPVPVAVRRGRMLALRRIIDGACNIPGRGMASKLAKAILAAYRNEFE